jgi:hypothetical protein
MEGLEHNDELLMIDEKNLIELRNWLTNKPEEVQKIIDEHSEKLRENKMREYQYYWNEENMIKKVLVTYEGYNPYEKIPVRDQAIEVRKKVREFENKLVDILKNEVEKILQRVE